jgi:protein required for attachment to host cells
MNRKIASKTPRIRQGDWVIVCDGSKALILENRGDEKFPNLRKAKVQRQPGAPTRRLGTDAPGRVYQSVGGSRSAVEQADLHDAAEREFLLALAASLENALSSGTVTRFIIVAPSRALGMLRGGYSPALKKAITAELNHDWVKLPIDEIEKRLFT